jgi:hypothetical protein
VREFQPIEGFLHLDPLDNCGLWDVHDVDFMGGMAGVQDRGEFSVWVHRDVDRKVSEVDLRACGSERPRVRKED